MREIKFRAWDFQKKEWASRYCDEIIGGLELPIHDYFKSNGKEITRWDFQQYTGAKDHMQKDIYEGDVLEDEDGHIFVMQFDKKCLRFGMRDLKTMQFENFYYFPEDYSSDDVKVIGSIHTNPELLGE
jgi:hypothetical protein